MNRIRSWALGLVCLASMSLGAAATVQAQGAYVSTDRFGYSGAITRYTSLEDLLAGTNPVAYTVPARDLAIYMVHGNEAFGGTDARGSWANAALFLSSWYYTNSPSNQNTGFIQQYDIEGGSVTSMDGKWLDEARTSYGFSVTGGDGASGCVSPGDCGRLWNAGSTLGSSATTAGVFYQYALNFTASGLASATWNQATGVFASVSEPTSVFGSLVGIFQNTSLADPSSNGWYQFDLALNMDSWAYVNTPNEYITSEFGSAQVTPEPASLALVATGLLGLGLFARRRRRAA